MLDPDALIMLCAPTGRARRRMYEKSITCIFLPQRMGNSIWTVWEVWLVQVGKEAMRRGIFFFRNPL